MRTWPAVAALGGWTVFLWVTRVKNALADDAMSNGGKAVALVTSGLFLGGAVGVVVAHARGARHAPRAAAVFAVVSIGYWLVRAATILGRDRSVGFKTVHTVLALVTVGLGGWVLRSVLGRSSERGLARTPA